MLELDGWDCTTSSSPPDGDMALLLDELARSLETFSLDLGADIDRVVVVLMSEFGRRLAENGSAGLDRGHGYALLLMGGHAVGGQVHGTWPALAPDVLDEGDLTINPDVRDVQGEVLAKRLANATLDEVLPGHTVSLPGVIA